MHSSTPSVLRVLALASLVSALPTSVFAQSGSVITGPSAFTDYTQEHPGVRRKITVADLPQPKPDESVDNGPSVVPRPEGAWPIAPAGFKVEMYAQGFKEPRLMRTAPNGDIFLADSHGDKIMVLRGVGHDGKAATVSTFASDLDLPFGIAFYPSGPNPKWVYVGNTKTVVRFPYKSGDLVATGKPETIVAELPGFAQLRGGGHWTRDVVFSPDGTKMLVSVGSASNADDPDTHPNEFHRADVLEFTPEGKFIKVYASGIRNCVGEAINPTTGQLWCSTNERDRLGDNLVPRLHHERQRRRLLRLALVLHGWPSGPPTRGHAPGAEGQGHHSPDVILQPHFASLELAFYTGKQFPSNYDGDGFAAEHGSWNRAHRSGYEVIRIPMHDGPRYRRVRGLSDRIRHLGWQSLGPSRWRHRGQGRFALRNRRWLKDCLARQLHRKVEPSQHSASKIKERPRSSAVLVL